MELQDVNAEDLFVMLRIFAVLVPAVCLAFPALAVDARIKKQLLALDPAERMEQTCDTEAMARISKEKDKFSADKVIAYTFGDPVVEEDSIKAPGAVFRSKGEWYRLSYECTTGPQHVNVRSLSYRIGDKVPRNQWGEYYLYD